MKKKCTAPLSIAVVTMGLLTLTSCGNNNDTSVSAMNEMPIPTETSTITEETSSIEIEAQSETETREEEEDSTSTDIPFAEDGERGEDFSTVEEPTETINTTGGRTLPFTVDDFDLSEDDKGFVQYVIDSYEAGDENVDYLFVLSVLADAGVDTTKLYDDYVKSQGTSSNPTTNTQQTQQQPDNIIGHWVIPGVTPEETITAQPLHPELSDVHAY